MHEACIRVRRSVHFQLQIPRASSPQAPSAGSPGVAVGAKRKDRGWRMAPVPEEKYDGYHHLEKYDGKVVATTIRWWKVKREKAKKAMRDEDRSG